MKNNSDSSAELISQEFMHMLNLLAVRASSFCKQLNGDNRFIQSVNEYALKGGTDGVKTEHIFMADFITFINGFIQLPDKKAHSVAHFTLIYFYEFLQGKDLNKKYSLNELRTLTLSVQFNKNVKLIKDTPFFPILNEMEGEFMVAAGLAKMKSEYLPVYAAIMNGILSLIVKSDGEISAEEKAFMHGIIHKLNNPNIIEGSSELQGIPENDTLELALDELNSLIGMEEIKKSVLDLTNFLKVQRIREEKGLKASKNALHSVFMGPPGTGKTTIARLLGRIYKHLGYLEKGHVIETDRAGLVAGYVGQTAIKTKEIIEKAHGGVLFIDEAYSLSTGGFNDYGQEAVEILLKRMEDKRGDLVVVAAGYPDEMEDFIQSNPGLQSRFNRYFKFDHFSPEALLNIFKMYVSKADFKLTEDAEEKVTEIIDRVYEKRHKSFGNARTMRNLFENIIEKQANRIVEITPVTNELLMTITEEDVPEVLKAVNSINLFNEG
ncbi:hypothetical protein GCM10011506_19390 [Marivirga lumbricoides]|uniref:AAA+ ATPase domain-containing protein n=1 Tax=Marivirga lumbricoides TaxID=1046115 RepID=A0ABQ1M5K8_9BACT|nr:hypothetical protein GCM10011506_19390 [Marivirga lumbricoides]